MKPSSLVSKFWSSIASYSTNVLIVGFFNINKACNLIVAYKPNIVMIRMVNHPPAYELIEFNPRMLKFGVGFPNISALSNNLLVTIF